MQYSQISNKSVQLHLTNVTGLGASQLLLSLLPFLERIDGFDIDCIYLPDKGPLSTYIGCNSTLKTEVYKRYLPNSLSRLLECTVLSKRFNAMSPILVFGDIPIRYKGPQTVFVQQSNLVRPKDLKLYMKQGLRFLLSRAIFTLNQKKARAFIVQTEVMREALESSYPAISGRVHVVAQPVPTWLLESDLRRTNRINLNSKRLSLFYPAAGYPHKNHSLLSKCSINTSFPVENLKLTLCSENNPAPHLPWIECVGFLSPKEMLETYSTVDALLFLSKEESYGFPLIEAMFIGLPIVCPDLPYARELCGENAIYFSPDNSESLFTAMTTLQSLLNQGWWPNWADRLEKIPTDWQSVARKMLQITCSVESMPSKSSQ